MITTRQIDNMRFEGEQATENLAKIARELGYDNGGLEQLQLNNGCFLTDLTHLLEDNSELCECMVEWIKDNLVDEQDEEESDEDEDMLDDELEFEGQAHQPSAKMGNNR